MRIQKQPKTTGSSIGYTAKVMIIGFTHLDKKAIDQYCLSSWN